MYAPPFHGELLLKAKNDNHFDEVLSVNILKEDKDNSTSSLLRNSLDNSSILFDLFSHTLNSSGKRSL